MLASMVICAGLIVGGIRPLDPTAIQPQNCIGLSEAAVVALLKEDAIVTSIHGDPGNPAIVKIYANSRFIVRYNSAGVAVNAFRAK